MDNPHIDKYGTQCWYNGDGQLHRGNDLPAVVFTNGTQYWYKHGQRHRDNDLPAVVYADGSQWWYKHDQVHRDNDLPAIVCTNGECECERECERECEWWLNDVKYTPVMCKI